MELDRDEKKVALSLKREKGAYVRHYTQSAGKQVEGKGYEGKEAIAYATPYPEEEGVPDLGWFGWPMGGGFGGVNFNGESSLFSNVLYLTETCPAPPALQATACPVPEPSTPMMLFVGVVSLAAIQWLRRKAR